MSARTWCIVAALGLAHPSIAHAQEDHTIVFEIGAAGDWERGGALNPGGTFAFEVTPIEHWLEIEVGATAIADRGGLELPVDILFKKPWQPSQSFEVMVGVGPVAPISTSLNAILSAEIRPASG